VAINPIYENLKIAKSLSAKQFDKLMAQGFFRNGQSMFKTQLMLMHTELYTSIGIRLDLTKHEFSKSLRKLLKKNAQRFEVKVRPVEFSSEKQELWEQHQHRFVGASTHSLYNHFCYEGYNNFDSWEVSVYDGSKLIAASFFDLGQNSMASILGLFDQQYTKESLGIYTMLVEISLAQKLSLRYYYPGYVLDQPSLFDYKLRLGNFERYNWHTGRWRAYDKNYFPTIATHTTQQLVHLEQLLNDQQIGYAKKAYQFYLWKYFTEFPDYKWLYPSPIMFVIGYQLGYNPGLLSISFDADTQLFFLTIAEVYVPITNMFGTVAFAPDTLNTANYVIDALKVTHTLIEDPSAEVVVAYLKALLAKDPTIAKLIFEHNANQKVDLSA
jgi:arginine-tRNA-protein transferase